MKANFANSVLKVVMVYALCFSPACSTNGSQAGDSGDHPEEHDSDTIGGTESDLLLDTETNTGPHVTGTDSENITSTDANTDSYSGADTDSYSDTNTGSDTDTNTDTDTDTDSTVDSEYPTDTEAPPDGCVVYVDGDAGDDGNTGESWSAAKATIPSAITSAEYFECTEIWVAEGTYTPTQISDPEDAITLIEGMSLYGGFVSGDTERTDRRPLSHPTVISGDIDGDLPSEVLVRAASNTKMEGFTFRGATTAWYGQGITAALEKCRFLNNEIGVDATDGEIDVADAWFESNAQGIYSTQGLSLNISNSTFTEHTQMAIHAYNAVLNVESSEFYKNNGALWGRASEATISDSVFQNNAIGPGSIVPYNGGSAIYNEASKFTISNCSFLNNRADDGAAIYFGNGLALDIEPQLSVTDSVFRGNEATTSGGAIYIDAQSNPTTIRGCTFTKNSGGSGVAIQTTGGNLIVEDSTFEDHFSSNGGTVVCGAGNNPGSAWVELYDTTFRNNHTEKKGGSLYVSSSCGVVVRRSSFVDNTAMSSGGAIFVVGSVYLYDVLISGNISSIGGGIFADSTYSRSARLTLTSVTLSGNTAQEGIAPWYGGLSYDGDSTEITITNSIIHGNEAHVYSTQQENPTAGYSSLEEVYEGDGNITDAPRFVASPLATTATTGEGSENTIIIAWYQGVIFNGFVIELDDDGIERTVTSVNGEEITFEPALENASRPYMRVDIWGESPETLEADYRLQPDSPGVNAGSNDLLDTDQDMDLAGNPRIVDDIVDMGAFETQL